MKDVIFDVDGTLSDSSDRMKYIEGPKKNWDRFYNEVIFDDPIPEVVWLAQTLRKAGCKIVICTGRPEKIRDLTEHWLEMYGVEYDKMYMRPTKDHRPDYIVKEELLAKIMEDGFDPFMVFDDRSSVVKMWRKTGLLCAQVADNNT